METRNTWTLTVSWQIYYQHVNCDIMWRVRIATQNYTLYPNHFPEDVPIAMTTEYNVSIDSNTAFCTENVTISLHITENVLEHVPYVVCIIRTGSGATVESYQSDKVYLSSLTHIAVTTTLSSITATDLVSQGNPLTLVPTVSLNTVSVKNSSCDQYKPHYVHLLLTICGYFIINVILI